METRKVNGATIRVIREALGVSHGIFADRIGISRSFLTRIETGQRQPSGEVARKIANGLGAPYEAITYPVSPVAVA